MLYYSNYTNSNNCDRSTQMNDEEIEQSDIEILMQLNQLNLDRICALEATVTDLIEIIVGLVRAN